MSRQNQTRNKNCLDKRNPVKTLSSKLHDKNQNEDLKMKKSIKNT